MGERAQLSVYRFDPGALFEGHLAAAIERMELGGDTKLLDALFVARDPESGALEAIDLGAAGADGTFASVLDFRLDRGRRRAITEHTLTEHKHAVPSSLIAAIGAELQPGDAIFAVLHTGGATTALEAAVARCPGRQIADERVEALALAQLGERLTTAAAGSTSTT